jgi:starch synthase (maltosyl-transferring)
MEIKNLYPEIDGGRYSVKTEIDRDFFVEADISAAGRVEVRLLHRAKGSRTWNRLPMSPLAPPGPPNRHRGFVHFDRAGLYEYMVEAAPEEGSHAGRKGSREPVQSRILEVCVDPVVARFGAWYELFARSQGRVPGRGGTFKDCEARLPDIRKMGFDVIYLAPIHPIGHTNRKGPNNTLWAGPGDPGCVWSIGDESGGHTAVHPELGTLEDFRHFVKKAGEQGIRIALDVALTCSYDHPWLKAHPGWFFHNTDGTIKYAENPPKKYEDTVFLNFYPPDREKMWKELRNVFLFWIKQGVSIFRIDNPHTKPDEFWQWAIRDIKAGHPEAVFLSEAFTYYERVELLAKLGFSQSYTYFTWRNTRDELIEYISRLTQSYTKEFLRPNFFANTPDILPKMLQEHGRPAFMSRLALAATLSPSYGIYSSYEMCENRSTGPGSESYADSEKYAYKVWDWDRQGNIKDFIAAVNKARQENPALHFFDNLQFAGSTDDEVLAFAKSSPDGSNNILVAVNLDPKAPHTSRLTVPVEKLGLGSGETYRAVELLTGRVYWWKGRENYVLIDPSVPAMVFRLEPGSRSLGRLMPSPAAQEHFNCFSQLRERATRQSDILARREMTQLYNTEIAPRVYTGPRYVEVYQVAIDRLAQKKGFESVIEMYVQTPGH